MALHDTRFDHMASVESAEWAAVLPLVSPDFLRKNKIKKADKVTKLKPRRRCKMERC